MERANNAGNISPTPFWGSVKKKLGKLFSHRERAATPAPVNGSNNRHVQKLVATLIGQRVSGSANAPAFPTNASGMVLDVRHGESPLRGPVPLDDGARALSGEIRQLQKQVTKGALSLEQARAQAIDGLNKLMLGDLAYAALQEHVKSWAGKAEEVRTCIKDAQFEAANAPDDQQAQIVARCIEKFRQAFPSANTGPWLESWMKGAVAGEAHDQAVHNILCDAASTESPAAMPPTMQRYGAARYYQLVGAVLDAFQTIGDRMHEAQTEPDAAVRKKLITRLRDTDRAKGTGTVWKKGKPSPDAPSLRTLKLEKINIGRGGQASIHRVRNEEGVKMVQKHPHSGKRSHVKHEIRITRRLYNEVRGQWHPNLLKTWAYTADKGLLIESISTGKDAFRLLLRMQHALFSHNADGSLKRLPGKDGKEHPQVRDKPVGGLTSVQLHGAIQFLAYRLLSVSQFLTLAGYAHYDLKLDNILIDKTGEPVVVDFGGMNRIGKAPSVTTCAFAAPELYASEEARQAHLHKKPVLLQKGNEKTDVFMTGSVLYETNMNALPYDTDQPLPQFDDSNALQRALKNIMEPDPDKRSNAIAAQMEELLSDRLLSDDEARAVWRKALTLRVQG